MLLYKSGLSKYIKNSDRCRERVKLSRLTTYGLGGYADSCYFPKTPYQAKRVYSYIKAKGEEPIILGNGSNVLISDSGITSSIICLKKMKGIIRLSETRIYCLAGTKISEILKYCKKHSLSGIEYMFGIPASIGGAAFMNAGIGNYAISQNIVNIDYFGDICGKISAKQCKFGYRQSTMRNMNGVILAVTLDLHSASPNEIEEKVNYFKRKRVHLPKGRSCGCVFKNGANYSSGELIDLTGLKGTRIGGAYVSEAHANFIINDGGSADDIKRLINFVKERVFHNFGVQLQEEVVYIGDFK